MLVVVVFLGYNWILFSDPADVHRVVGGEILLNIGPVFGLAGLFRCISHFLVCLCQYTHLVSPLACV